MLKRIEILWLAFKCWFEGDTWEDAVWYAESIVNGWKKEKK